MGSGGSESQYYIVYYTHTHTNKRSVVLSTWQRLVKGNPLGKPKGPLPSPTVFQTMIDDIDLVRRKM